MSTDSTSDVLISVVMPVYNAASYVAEAVTSILDQTFDQFEFLIFDDGSTDDSPAILEAFAQRDGRIRVTRGEHRGYVHWLNEGIRLARGRFIARMDADDSSMPERFALQVQHLSDHPQCVVVGSGVVAVDAEGHTIRVEPKATDARTLRHQLLQGKLAVITHPTAMVRTEAMRAVGGYRDMSPAEDFDLWLRLMEMGDLENLPQPLLRKRYDPANVSIAQLQRCREAVQEAWSQSRARRGLPPSRHPIWDGGEMTAADWHRIWARGALSDGNRIAARKHARKSLALQRLNPRAMGVLMASALPARFAATLLALRARLLRRRERDSTLPEGDGQGGDE